MSEVQEYPLERINWVDSAGFSHDGPWIGEAEMNAQIREHGVLDCISVGFVVRETIDIVVIASSITTGMVLSPMAIPKSAITARLVLNEG